jgi:hypothetical protein
MPNWQVLAFKEMTTQVLQLEIIALLLTKVKCKTINQQPSSVLATDTDTTASQK